MGEIRIKPRHKKALAILAGCPTGATEEALALSHGITRATLDELVASGLVVLEMQRIARVRGLLVPRFRIASVG